MCTRKGLLLLALVFVASCVKSSCPFVRSTSVTTSPATPCLEPTVSVCVGATLHLQNNCTDTLSLPSDFAVFAHDAWADPTVDVVRGAGVNYELKKEKAVSRSVSREDYVLPGKLGGKDVTIAFSIFAE